MNLLLVGTDKSKILDHLPTSFLLIDDGELIDQLTLPKQRTVRRFDVTKDSFNPLQGINYDRACDFVDVINAVFRAGENTLTRELATTALLDWLLTKPEYLSHFPRADKKDVGLASTAAKIHRLLLSPVLKNVLDNPTNFTFKGSRSPRGIILARLDRRVLREFDCKVIANVLISQYRGTVVIPDEGFYACPFHASLIRQDRLIAGVNFLDECPEFRNELLLIDNKKAGHCTEQDAKTLAPYFGWHSGKTGYNEFIQGLIE